MKKRLYQYFVLSLFILGMTIIVRADVMLPSAGSGRVPDDNNLPERVPLDGGLSILLSLAAIYGVTKRKRFHF